MDFAFKSLSITMELKKTLLGCYERKKRGLTRFINRRLENSSSRLRGNQWRSISLTGASACMRERRHFCGWLHASGFVSVLEKALPHRMPRSSNNLTPVEKVLDFCGVACARRTSSRMRPAGVVANQSTLSLLLLLGAAESPITPIISGGCGMER